MSHYCYRTVMRFWQDDPVEVSVRYYRADANAKAFNGWHCFGPGGRERERDVLPGPVGEAVFPASLGYDRGQNTGGWTGQHFDGSLEAWRSGGVHGTTPPIEADAKGGTDLCPWQGPPGPVVLATVPHMSGHIVAVGAPGILSRFDAEGDPDPSWNPEVLPALARWAVSVGEEKPLAAVWITGHWAWFGESPYFGEFGSDRLDYSADSAQEELRVQLRSANALVLGFHTDDESTPDWIDERVIDIVHSWVCGGGVLILVGDIDQFDADGQHPANHVLGVMNAEMRFEHGDIDPRNEAGWHHMTPGALVEIAWGWAPWTSPANILLDRLHYASQDFGHVLLRTQKIQVAFTPSENRIAYGEFVRIDFDFWTPNAGYGGDMWLLFDFERGVQHVERLDWGGENGWFLYSRFYRIAWLGPDFRPVGLTAVTFYVELTLGTLTVPLRMANFGIYLTSHSLETYTCALNPRHAMVADGDDIYLSSLVINSGATIVRGDWVAAVIDGPPVSRPQGQFYTAFLEGHGVGTFAGPATHAVGVGGGQLAQLDGLGVADYFTLASGTGGGMISGLEGVGLGNYLTAAEGAGGGELAALDGLGSGSYAGNAVGGGGGDLGPLDGVGLGNYLTAAAGAGGGELAAIDGLGSGVYAAAASGTGGGELAAIDGLGSGVYAAAATGTGGGELAALDGLGSGTYALFVHGIGGGDLAALAGLGVGSFSSNAAGVGGGQLVQLDGLGVGGYTTHAHGTGVGAMLPLDGTGAGTYFHASSATGAGAGSLANADGSGTGWSQTLHGDKTYSGPGTWHCPIGVTTADVRCWGGGGSAAATPTSNGTAGGGGGGAYAGNSALSVTAGTGYGVQPGQPQALGIDGQATSFDGLTLVAAGGKKGTASAGGAGGTVAGSIGVTKHAGGAGAAGNGTSFGGGGGGGAGDGMDGGAAVTFSGGTSGTAGGGTGGAGGRSGVAATAGFAAAGGGGGGIKSATVNWASQKGAAGAVRVIW